MKTVSLPLFDVEPTPFTPPRGTPRLLRLHSEARRGSDLQEVIRRQLGSTQ